MHLHGVIILFISFFFEKTGIYKALTSVFFCKLLGNVTGTFIVCSNWNF